MLVGDSDWAVPGVIGDPAVVVMVGLDVMRLGEDTPLDCAGKCPEWDIRNDFETIDGMPVYYGGNLCNSDKADWEDPYDIACAEYVEQYNFDTLEGMELKVFERLKGPGESVMMVSERTGSKHVHQASAGYPRWESDMMGTGPVADVFTGRHDVPDVAVSPNHRSCSDTYGGGAALYYEGDISDSDCGSVQDHEKDTWKDWCDSAFRNGYGVFPPDTDDPLPTVVFNDKLFLDEDIADMPVSDNEEMPVSALQVFADEGVPLVHPDIVGSYGQTDG